MARVIVASRNPVKLGAVERGFRRMFPTETLEFLRAEGNSGVADQPNSNAETLRGASNRARAAEAAAPDGDYWVGVEGGVQDSDRGMAAFAWVVVSSRDISGHGRTATFFLPERVAELVRGGMELGAADDQVFGRKNSKQKDGAIGLLTGNVVDRTALYEQGVIMALVAFKNRALYAGDAPPESDDDLGWDSSEAVRLRPATAADGEAMLAIYAPLVADTTISFELTPPSLAEFTQRIEGALSWLVAERDGAVLGYAYATTLRSRAAYRWSVETSAYVHPQAQVRGVGTMLYRGLIRELAESGYCNAYAAIALPNEASVVLHERVGFEPIGVFSKVGRKFGRWIDVGWWQRRLRDEPPEDS